jgi:hypothetical protein
MLKLNVPIKTKIPPRATVFLSSKLRIVFAGVRCCRLSNTFSVQDENIAVLTNWVDFSFYKCHSNCNVTLKNAVNHEGRSLFLRIVGAYSSDSTALKPRRRNSINFCIISALLQKPEG